MLAMKSVPLIIDRLSFPLLSLTLILELFLPTLAEIQAFLRYPSLLPILQARRADDSSSIGTIRLYSSSRYFL